MTTELMQWFPFILAFLPRVSSVPSPSKGRPLYGVNMCLQKCLTTKACKHLSYSPLTLACHLQSDAMPSSKSIEHKIHLTKADLLPTDVDCIPGNRILHTRQGSIRCVPGVKGKSKAKSTRKHVKASRLLFCPRRGRDRVPVSQVELQQEQLETQRYWPLTLMKVYSLLYSHITNSLYVAYYFKINFIVYVSKLDSYETRVIRVDSVGVMALDEERDWILICKRTFNGVFKIVGQNMTMMFKYKMYGVGSMVVRSASAKIYVASYMTIYTFTYSGKRDVVAKTNGVGPIGLDPQGKYLFYDTLEYGNSYIIRYNTITQKSVRFTQISEPLEDIVVDSYNVFVKPVRMDIAIYELSTKRKNGTIHVKGKVDTILCLVV